MKTLLKDLLVNNYSKADLWWPQSKLQQWAANLDVSTVLMYLKLYGGQKYMYVCQLQAEIDLLF